jgi:hypothetical protein
MIKDKIKIDATSLEIMLCNCDGRPNTGQTGRVNVNTHAHLPVLVCSGKWLQMLHVNRRHDGFV